MLQLKIVLALIVAVLFSPAIMAHTGSHSDTGIFTVLIHHLTSVDHWLLLLVMCLFVVLFLPVLRRL